MVRSKRPYVPKVKGCYECSQRRIDCDRAEPSCIKCTSRNINCSGFGSKYKFRDGFPPRHRKGKLSFQPQRSCPAGPASPKPHGTDSLAKPGETPSDVFISPANRELNRVERTPRPSDEKHHPADAESQGDNQLVEGSQVEIYARHRSSQSSRISFRSSIECLTADPSLDGAWTQFLLRHFSENIAPEMVVIDDSHNGWRSLVLPMAHADQLIMSAVLAVSSCHLAQRFPNTHLTGTQDFYGEAIRSLKDRMNLGNCDARTKQSVIIAIVVLLVSVMVTGSSDFPIVFRMLQSALDAVGGEEKLVPGDPVTEFSLREIRKMRVYAAPLLSEQAGVHAMVCQAQESFDCLQYYDRLHPEFSPILKVLADLRQQVFDMYLERVLVGKDDTPTTENYERFISTIKLFPQGSPGENLLIWPVFMAASGCEHPDHRAFFEQFLERQLQRNGFGNISKALEFLRTIWAGGDDRDWPGLLPEPKVFVM